MPRKIRIWSIYDRDDRLVLALSDEPGEFNFAKIPPSDADPVECPFATIQCYDRSAEPEVLNILFKASDIDDLLEALRKNRYKIREGRPKTRRFARL